MLKECKVFRKGLHFGGFGKRFGNQRKARVVGAQTRMKDPHDVFHVFGVFEICFGDGFLDVQQGVCGRGKPDLDIGEILLKTPADSLGERTTLRFRTIVGGKQTQFCPLHASQR